MYKFLLFIVKIKFIFGANESNVAKIKYVFNRGAMKINDSDESQAKGIKLIQAQRHTRLDDFFGL